MFAKYFGLSRPLATILIQTRIGKVSLNDFLFSLQRLESAKCSCSIWGGLQHAVAHALLGCPKYTQLRRDFLWQGENNQDFKEILTEPALAKQAAVFMARTGVLGEPARRAIQGWHQAQPHRVTKRDIPCNRQ